MIRTILLLAALCLAAPAQNQTKKIRPTPAKPTQVKPKRPASKKVVPTPRSRTRRAAVSRQLQPTAERFMEIQDALIARGFLAGPSTGKWDATSIDALKRFEQSQKLKPDGKLDSLALIALGLGPKRTPDTGLVTREPEVRF
jgi:hypothetical protein